jgi:hypothetical protein
MEKLRDLQFPTVHTTWQLGIILLPWIACILYIWIYGQGYFHSTNMNSIDLYIFIDIHIY